MYMYKDYGYVSDIYENYPLEEALLIYVKVCEQDNDDKLWDLYLIHIPHSKESCTFEQFKKKQKALAKSKHMDDVEKQRIQMNTDDIREQMKHAKGTVVNVRNLK